MKSKILKSDSHDRSIQYKEPGMFFDDHPNTAFTISPKIPQIVRVIAVENNKFKSKVKNFKSYEGM